MGKTYRRYQQYILDELEQASKEVNRWEERLRRRQEAEDRKEQAEWEAFCLQEQNEMEFSF